MSSWCKFVLTNVQGLIAAMPVKNPGPHPNIKMVFPWMGISTIKITRSWDRLIFIVRIHILIRRYFCTEKGLRLPHEIDHKTPINTVPWCHKLVIKQMSVCLCSSLEHDRMSLMMTFFRSSLSLFPWHQPVIAWIRNSRLEFINIPLSKCACEQMLCKLSVPKHYIYLKSDTGFDSSRPSDAYMRRKTNHHWFR